MIMKKIFTAVVVFCFMFAASLASASSSPPSPPAAQPATGYGSPAKYICSTLYNGGAIDHNSAIDIGDTNAGTRCWIYIPSKLKNGATAPVVIYLHGFMALVPPIYAGQIKHLVRQGYIVIFPEYNLGGFTGLFSDMDQYQMCDRAIAAVNTALALPDVAARAERNNIYMASHSNGGNVSLCWTARGGVPVKALIMQHPCVSMEAIPSFVRDLFMGNLIELDTKTMAAQVNCPMIVIGGTQDSIATPSQLNNIMNWTTNAPSKVEYFYDADDHGDADLKSDHGVPCQDDGWIPGFILDLMSGMGISAFIEDGNDYRIMYAAVDAVLDGKTRLAFDRGKWSDGTAVKPVVNCYDPTVTGVMLYQHCDYNAGTSGYAVQLTKGSYNLTGLSCRGFTNDSLSSIKIPAGWKVTLYKDDGFSGTSKVLTANNSCLTGIGFNDVVSSIKVE
jgi:dienelactone hydrolase